MILYLAEEKAAAIPIGFFDDWVPGIPIGFGEQRRLKNKAGN